MKPFDAHICTECDTPHVDNCHNCFGYGLHKGTNNPIRAGAVQELLEKSMRDFVQDELLREVGLLEEMTFEPHESKYFDICPVCGGSPFNLDIFTLWGNPTEQKPIGILKA